MVMTVDLTDIYAVVKHISELENQEDMQIIHAYTQELRDAGVSPGKTVERAVDWAERFLLQAHPDMGQVITMRLASHYVSDIAKTVGVHAAQRRKEKVVSE